MRFNRICRGVESRLSKRRSDRVMRPVDLLLLHPPTTFESPTGLSLHNMIAVSAQSTAAREMYPLGFLSTGEYLERHGYHVSICNLALLNSLAARLRSETILRRMQARMVGIDLPIKCRWLPK